MSETKLQLINWLNEELNKYRVSEMFSQFSNTNWAARNEAPGLFGAYILAFDTVLIVPRLLITPICFLHKLNFKDRQAVSKLIIYSIMMTTPKNNGIFSECVEVPRHVFKNDNTKAYGKKYLQNFFETVFFEKFEHFFKNKNREHIYKSIIEIGFRMKAQNILNPSKNFLIELINHANISK